MKKKMFWSQLCLLARSNSSLDTEKRLEINAKQNCEIYGFAFSVLHIPGGRLNMMCETIPWLNLHTVFKCG